MPKIRAARPRTTNDSPPRTFDGLGVSRFAFNLKNPLTGDYAFQFTGWLCSDSAWSPSDKDETRPIVRLSMNDYVAKHAKDAPDLAAKLDRLKAAILDVASEVFVLEGHAKPDALPPSTEPEPMPAS